MNTNSNWYWAKVGAPSSSSSSELSKPAGNWERKKVRMRGWEAWIKSGVAYYQNGRHDQVMMRGGRENIGQEVYWWKFLNTISSITRRKLSATSSVALCGRSRNVDSKSLFPGFLAKYALSRKMSSYKQYFPWNSLQNWFSWKFWLRSFWRSYSALKVEQMWSKRSPRRSSRQQNARKKFQDSGKFYMIWG